MDNLTSTKKINLLCVRVCVKCCCRNVAQCVCVLWVCLCVQSDGWGCHCCLLVSCSVVPTERGGELCPFRGVQHRPTDGEHRSNTGEASIWVCVCLCARVCGSAEQISGLICENATWPVSSDLVFVPYSPYQQPPLLGTARPLGQFATARLDALLYRVNKVSGVSVARGIGDRLTATSSLSW